jgi:hypothetical protein
MLFIVYFENGIKTWVELFRTKRAALNRVAALVDGVYWEIVSAPKTSLYYDKEDRPCFSSGSTHVARGGRPDIFGQ